MRRIVIKKKKAFVYFPLIAQLYFPPSAISTSISFLHIYLRNVLLTLKAISTVLAPL